MLSRSLSGRYDLDTAKIRLSEGSTNNTGYYHRTTFDEDYCVADKSTRCNGTLRDNSTRCKGTLRDASESSFDYDIVDGKSTNSQNTFTQPRREMRSTSLTRSNTYPIKYIQIYKNISLTMFANITTIQLVKTPLKKRL